MPRHKRQASTFNLSFLDIMSCGFGAVVLVFLIVDHSMENQSEIINADALSEINLLDQDIKDGEEGLVVLRNAIASTDLKIVDAQGRAARITEDLDSYRALISSLTEDSVTENTEIEDLKAEVDKVQANVEKLRETAAEQSGRSARDFVGDGNRQYLTGLNLGGSRILLLVDVSASMLADSIVNIEKLRARDPESQRKESTKWSRTLDTVDWLASQLPQSAYFQIIAFNTKASAVIPATQNRWLEVENAAQLDEAILLLRERLPAGGTNLYQAFDSINNLPGLPDNIFLITDGLPTQGNTPSSKTTVSEPERRKFFTQASSLLPRGIPVNVILAPMQGDPNAAVDFWNLAQRSGGAFLSPALDWP